LKDNQPKKKKNRPGRKTGTKIKHGSYSLIARGSLPKKRRYLEGFLTKVREGLIRDYGPGEENLTTAQLILVDRVIGKLGVLRCIEEYSRESGVMEGQELSPPLKKNYLSWANSLRLDLQALGLDKRASDEILDPQAYVAEKYGEGKDD